jgi:hypothetical protein
MIAYLSGPRSTPSRFSHLHFIQFFSNNLHASGMQRHAFGAL